MLDYVPKIAVKYGQVAAAAAADWYEQTRAEQIGGSYEALTADTYSTDAIASTVRWQASRIYAGDSDGMAAFLAGSMNRWVQQAGRDTIMGNVARDPSKPRYARVPRGVRTCAFCEMLASRGAVYYTQTTAGKFSKFHSDCDCQIVATWDSDSIEGYDPQDMYERYSLARDKAETGNKGQTPSTESILANMRRMFPSSYTDGVDTSQ